jgi:hypothetical protein
MDERLHPGTPTFGHSFEGHNEDLNSESTSSSAGKSIPSTDLDAKEDKKVSQGNAQNQEK